MHRLRRALSMAAGAQPTACWSRPTSSYVSRARRKKLIDGVRPGRLPRRRFIRARVHGRNCDEAGVADDINQNFHPDRHGKALVQREFPGDVVRSAARLHEIAASVFSKLKTPTGIRRYRWGLSCSHLFEAAALAIENGAARGSFPAHCAYLMRGFRDRDGFRGTVPRVLTLSPRNEVRRLR